MERIFLATTTINISEMEVKVHLYRTKGGSIEWIPIEEHKDILESGGYLENGTCVEGYNQEISITKYEP